MPADLKFAGFFMSLAFFNNWRINQSRQGTPAGRDFNNLIDLH